MSLPIPARRLALLMMPLLASACSDQQGSGDEGDVGGTLVIAAPGNGSSPTFPPHAADAVARMVVDQVYERLAEIGPELGTVGDRGFTPRLARRWEWGPDSLSIVFHLDPRARWHDGRPVRASDVRFTVNLLKDPRTATQYTAFITHLDSVSVRDSLTAVAWFRARSPEQFYEVAYQVYVLPEHLLKDIPREQLSTSEAAQRPIGSGRFRFGRAESGVRMELVADTAHYRGRPKLDRVIIAFAGQPNNAVTQLFSGQADFMDIVPPDAVPRLDSAQHLRAVPYTQLAYGFLVMNTRDPRRLSAPHPIFGDRNVRRALSMAVDREAMLRNVFGRYGTLGTGPTPKTLMAPDVELPPFDKARAEALLDSAGWRRGGGADSVRVKNGRPLAFAITVPTTSAPRMRYAVLLQEQLKSVGARVSIESMDFNATQERVTNGRFDATLTLVSQDPARTAIKQYWSADAIPPGGSNYGRYTNAAVDALIDSLAMPASDATLDRHWRNVLQTIANDAPAIWLYEYSSTAGAHRRLRIEGMRADGWWLGLADWWIPADQRIERDRIGLRPAQP